MDIRKLKYFIAVAEEKNISRAAERLHISQPPLTRQIHALEEELGVLLFNRTTWGVELTKAGEALLEHALKIKKLVEQTRDWTRDAEKETKNILNIGVFGSAMLSTVPKILNAFAEQHPDIKVTLHHAPRERQIEALRAGRIQAAFDRYYVAYPDIEVVQAYQEALMLAINQHHPLANQSSIHVSELRNLSMIGPMDAEAYAAVQSKYRKFGFELQFAHRSSDMASSVHLVAGNFGCAVVPESLQILQLPDVVYRPLVSDGESSVKLQCAYLKGPISPALSALLETVKTYQLQHSPETPE